MIRRSTVWLSARGSVLQVEAALLDDDWDPLVAVAETAGAGEHDEMWARAWKRAHELQARQMAGQLAMWDDAPRIAPGIVDFG